jgi:hypothetical protein
MAAAASGEIIVVRAKQYGHLGLSVFPMGEIRRNRSWTEVILILLSFFIWDFHLGLASQTIIATSYSNSALARSPVTRPAR